MMFWYDHNMGWWGHAGMGIGMVLFWALIVAGIVAVVVFVSRDRPFQQQPPTPEQILAARFARVRSVRPSTGIASQFCVIPFGIDENRAAATLLGDRHGLHHYVGMLAAASPPSLTAVGTSSGIAHTYLATRCLGRGAALRAAIFART